MTDEKQIEHRWREYFESLLNVTENISASTECENLSTDTDQAECEEPAGISLEEVDKAIHHMKNNKSPGSDELPSEIFKYGGGQRDKVDSSYHQCCMETR